MRPDATGDLFGDVSAGRRRIMRAISSNGTKPERAVRAMLQRVGYRFRKNLKGLPGRPDVAFTAKRKAIFVHGCFWHAHTGCKNAARPKTRSDYWNSKLNRNVARDRENLEALQQQGWCGAVVWECELGNMSSVERRLVEFLGRPRVTPTAKKTSSCTKLRGKQSQ
jgi:DNA mismatch endonuclease Vsr